MAEQLTDALVHINNVQQAIVPGSFSFTPGFGERSILAESQGGGRVSQVFATNQATAFSRVKLALYVTPENEKRVRDWINRRNRNVIQAVSADDEGNRLTRTFTQAAVMNDPEIGFSVDSTIVIEFQANQSV